MASKLLADISTIMRSAQDKNAERLNRILQLQQESKTLRRQRPTNAELIANFDNKIDEFKNKFFNRVKDNPNLLVPDLRVIDQFASSEPFTEAIAACCSDSLKREFAERIKADSDSGLLTRAQIDQKIGRNESEIL